MRSLCEHDFEGGTSTIVQNRFVQVFDGQGSGRCFVVLDVSDCVHRSKSIIKTQQAKAEGGK